MNASHGSPGTDETDVPNEREAPDGAGRDSRVAPAGSERSRHTPRRTVINYWVDLALGLLFVALAFATGVAHFVFPNGPIAYQYRVWGGNYGDWRELQFRLFAAFGLGILLHLMLHWNWLCCVTNTHVRNRPPGRDDGSRTLLGVGVLMAVLHLLGAGLLLAWWSLQTPHSY